MAVPFQDGMCSPFQPANSTCALGNLAVYSINATGAEDIAAGIQFTQKRNIRLVIKNTGHE